MLKSIRWKLIAVYFTLVFIAMIIVGIYITDRLESYNLDKIEQSLTSISTNIVNSMIDMKNLEEGKEQLQQNLNNAPIPMEYEISIIKMANGMILASTNPNFIDRYASDVLNPDVIVKSMTQSVTKLDTKEPGSNNYTIKNIAFSYPESLENEEGYIIYARAYLDSVYKEIDESKAIFLKATFISLAVTIILGFIIAGSITEPINDLKNKALKISGGDFSQRAKVNSNDEIGQLASTFNVLTERLDSTLEEINSEKSKLDSIINHMNDGLLALDKQGNIVLYNLSFKKLLDIPTDIKLTGLHVDTLFVRLKLDISFNLIKYITRSNIAREKTKKITLDNQKTINISPGYYSDDIGILKGYVIIFQDITESEQLENMRKEFVANVSHELKTPITTIKTYTETLLAGALEEKEMAENFLQVIDKEADRMTGLIRDLLQLSHIDYKKVVWDMKMYDINILISDCISRLSLYSQEKNQTVTFTSEKQSLKLRMDVSKMEQVLINIISNAIKYTAEQGQIDIKLTIQGAYACIAIKDNGMGIPEKDLPRLFERFYRVDKARSRDQGGTGLGLSIAKHIVEGHNGKIIVESIQNMGTTFTIKLPVDKTVYYDK